MTLKNSHYLYSNNGMTHREVIISKLSVVKLKLVYCIKSQKGRMEKQNLWLVFALLDSLKMDASYLVYLELNFMLYFVSVMLDQNLVSLLLWLISFSSMNVYVNKTQRM